MATLKDSGERRQFESGAVRDIQEGKGRCDLLPLKELARMYDLIDEHSIANILCAVFDFMHDPNVDYLYDAVAYFITHRADHLVTALSESILDVAKHYEDGCQKYGERNWEKGIPIHCYIDSGIRHLLKWKAGYTDEPHDRAFIWNMLGAAWTYNHKPELFDIQF